MIDERLVDLGNGVYMADRKLIKIDDGTIDVSTEEGQEELLSVCERIFEKDDYYRPWCVPYVPIIRLIYVESGDKKNYMLGYCHIADFPDDTKALLDSCFPGYLDDEVVGLDERIHDMGEGVYAMDDKVIKVNPDTRDVHTYSGNRWLYRRFEHLYTSRIVVRPYGDMNVNIVQGFALMPRGLRCVSGACHMGDLSDVVKDNLRKEFPDYAERI